eukprot:167242_1
MGRRMINPRVWCKVNGVVLSAAVMTYMMWIYFGKSAESNIYSYSNLLLTYCIATFRCYFYVIGLFISFRNTRKYFHEIHTDMENNRSFLTHVFWCCCRTSFSASVAAVIIDIFQYKLFGFRDQFDNYNITSFNDINLVIIGDILYQITMFILQMFVWEVWFDFGHYWGHRMAHIYKSLYEFGHIVHHESLSTDAFDGLNITFDDALLTNFVPHMLSLFITTQIFGFKSFSTLEYHIMGSYKTFVEVTGHVGADFRGRSFPLFPPLPYYLGIDIGTSAYHSVHHLYNMYNFSKRFTLWDRVFGTLVIPPVMETGSRKETLKVYKPVFKGKKKKKKK